MSEGILTAEAYANRHKQAFRIAFDFLNAHFPPQEGMEWWNQVAMDASEASLSQGENRLAMELVAAVMQYLEDEWKKRRSEDGADY